MVAEQPAGRPLVGRERELGRLEQLLVAAAHGHPRVALVHGEGGVGKTRLATVVADQAVRSRYHSLWGGCLRLAATSTPYLPLVTAVDGWVAEAPDDLVRSVAHAAPALAPVLRVLDPRLANGRPAPSADSASGTKARQEAGDGGRMLLAWENALAVIGADAPALVVVDDLQWADATSLDVLAFLATGLRRQCLMLLLIYRDTGLTEDEPLHSWLTDLRRLSCVADVQMRRFTEKETRDQIRALRGVDPRPWLVTAVHRRSSGNPYLTELLVQRIDPDTDDLTCDPPEALPSALLANWHRLSPPGRKVTQALAVAGGPTTSSRLAAVCWARDSELHDVTPALREATAMGLVIWDGFGRVSFRHPLLEEVLYATLLPTEQRDLHAAFAEIGAADLEVSAFSSDLSLLAERARHSEKAGRTDEAFACSMSAANKARAIQAFREEAALLCRAAQLWPQTSTETRHRYGSETDQLTAAANAARWSGDERTAVMLAERARSRADPAHDPLSAARALTLWEELAAVSGRQDAAPDDAFFQRVADLAGRFPDSPEHVRALADRAQVEAWRGNAAAARQHADAAVAAGRRNGDPACLSYALYTRTIACFGDAGIVRDAAESHRLAVASGQPEYVALASMAQVNALESQGRLAECVEVALAGQAAATKVGMGGLTPFTSVNAAHSLLMRGELPRAELLLREVLATRPTGDSAALVYGEATVAAVRLGDLPAAKRHVQALEDRAPGAEQRAGTRLPAALAEYLLASGRPGEALEMLEATLPVHAPSDPPYGDTMLIWAARAAVDLTLHNPGSLAADDARQAHQRIQAARRRHGHMFADPRHKPFNRVQRALYRAEVARLSGAPDQAEHWLAAVDASTAADLHYLATEARCRLAETLAGEGRRAEAAAQLRTAYRQAREMTARALQRDVETLGRLSRVDLAERVSSATDH